MTASSDFRLAVSERAFQTAVIDCARSNRWLVHHSHDSRRQVRPGVHVGDRDAAGYPDLTLVRERVVWAELKGAKTIVTPTQLAWIQALTDAGEECYLWRVGADGVWDEIERVLGRRR